MKETYKILAQQYGVKWSGRKYDRENPDLNDAPNQAINHAASAIEAAAMIAVAATSTLPHLGFIHEESSNAFVLDVADLFRDSVTLPAAFRSVREMQKQKKDLVDIEKIVRRLAGETIKKEKVIPKMIDSIKKVLDIK